MKKFRPIKIAGYMYQLHIRNAKNYFKPIVIPHAEVILENSIHWVGHATTIINLEQNVILTDPVMELRLFHLRRKVMPSYSSKAINADYILLSHGHMDHMNFATLKKLKKTSIVLCPYGFKQKIESLGFDKVVGIKAGDLYQDKHIKITAINSKHDGRRNHFSKENACISYLMESKTKSVLFISDTALTDTFDNIKTDAVIMPVGCYKPDEFQKLHCSPTQAFEMFKKMKSNNMIPVHYNTFILAQDDDNETIKILNRINDGSIKILEIGSTFKL